MTKRDWATDEAEKHLSFLFQCSTHAQRVEYFASVLRMTEAQGAVRCSHEFGALVDGIRLPEKVA